MIRILTLLAICTMATPAFADGHAAKGPAAERQTLMSHVGATTKIGAGIAKGQIPFDATMAEAVFRSLNSAALGFGYMFPEGSETGAKTEASPKIWSDRAGFDAQTAKFVADTSALPKTLDEFKTAFGAATANCGTCHRAYRVKN
ncbi:MAG: cytochrome c [Pseudomonadota bacterium]